MPDLVGSVYSYVYLPKHVKPWAMSCLEHLDGSEATKYVKYEVENYNKLGLSSDYKFSTYRHQLWCLYVNGTLQGVCLTSRVYLPYTKKCYDCISKEDFNRLNYFTHYKDDVWCICQCYDHKGIKQDNWPVIATVLDAGGVKEAVAAAKAYSNLVEFQNSTKEDFDFEEVE